MDNSTDRDRQTDRPDSQQCEGNVSQVSQYVNTCMCACIVQLKRYNLSGQTKL